MQFFKKRFGGQNEVKNNKLVDSKAEEFDQVWTKTLQLFEIISGLDKINFRLTHPRTGKPLKPHEGLNVTFKEWKQIQSSWDQRQYLFKFMLEGVGRSMKAWQIANIFTAMRGPNKALELLQENPQPSDEAEDYVAHCCAFTKAYLGLHQPILALEWAKKALLADSTNQRIKTLYADALRLTGECDDSEKIYTEQLQLAKQSSDANESIATMFATLFARDTGAISSPVLAIQLLEVMTDKNQADEFWRLSEAEFYDSPYFRMHHAYNLLKAGHTERTLAKLVALVQEMPWLREASLNLDILLKQIDPGGDKFMPEFQTQLRQKIRDENWTTEGMYVLNVDVKGNSAQPTSNP